MDILQAALGGLQTYGPIVLMVGLFLGGLGVPVPATLLLLAGGAFAREGRFDPLLALGLAWLGATGGDSTSYGMGFYGLRGLVARLERGAAWRKAEETFEQRGGAAIVLTRFLFTPLALPTNLIAGGDKYPFRHFVLLCGVGELVWVLLYGGLGFAFAQSWPLVSDWAGRVGGWLLGGVVVAIGLYEVAIHWHGHWKHHAPPGEPVQAASANWEKTNG